jgi:haloacetate dehalogenase
VFEDFEQRRVATSGAELNVMIGGDGPPLVLVHGFPQMHAMWHRIAPDLAQEFTVVAPDMRGYGDSSKPPGGERSVAYSKRAMALDIVELMASLGFDRFRYAGHDRGARVGYRLALDHPERVERMALLDIMPTLETFEAMDYRAALGAFHWLFLAQPHPLPETLIAGDPNGFLHHLLGSWSGSDDSIFAPEAVAQYERCFADPEAVRAMCDDYRAGATIDCEHDAAAREAGTRITCPLLILWGEGRRNRRPVMMEVWENWATNVEGRGLSCGHFLPEEAPEETRDALLEFFR